MYVYVVHTHTHTHTHTQHMYSKVYSKVGTQGKRGKKRNNGGDRGNWEEEGKIKSEIRDTRLKRMREDEGVGKHGKLG